MRVLHEIITLKFLKIYDILLYLKDGCLFLVYEMYGLSTIMLSFLYNDNKFIFTIIIIGSVDYER